MPQHIIPIGNVNKGFTPHQVGADTETIEVNLLFDDDNPVSVGSDILDEADVGPLQEPDYNARGSLSRTLSFASDSNNLYEELPGYDFRILKLTEPV